VSAPATVRTNSQGYASIYFHSPTTPGESIITAKAVSGSNSVTVEFSAQTMIAGQSPLPVNGLTIWLKANAGITKDANNKVSLWKDFSTTGHDAAQSSGAAQPLFVGNALNGLPIIRFDGSAGWMSIATALSDFTNGCTAFMVTKPTAVVNYARFFDFGSGQASK
jgi:hypothetical protein